MTDPLARPEGCASEHARDARSWVHENGWAGIRFLITIALDLMPIPGRHRPTF